MSSSNRSLPIASSSNNSGQESASFPEYIVHHLDISHINAWAKKVKHLSLSSEQLANIQKELDTSAATRLANLLSQFINFTVNADPLVGLTRSEIEQLTKLLEERKQLKGQFEKVELSRAEYEHLIANEKKIFPLDLTINWWSKNLALLKKDEIWQQIAAKTIKVSKEHGVPEKECLRMLSQLDNLKLDWMNQYYVAGYLSDYLLDFYNNHLSTMENNILAELEKKKKYSPLVSEYLSYLLSQLNDLKKQIIYSMIYRLQSAEHHQDIECDDVLAHLMENIEKQCSIEISGAGKKPALRRSLSPDLVHQFINAISAYCKNYMPSEHMLLTLEKLKLRHTPDEWKLAAITKETELLNNDPVILYAEYTIPGLLVTIQSDEAIAESILFKNALADVTHPINKTKKLIDTVAKRHLRLTNKSIHLSENPAALSFQRYAKKWDEQLSAIKTKIEALLNAEIQKCLISQSNTPDAITNLAIVIKNANQFNKQFFNEDYLPTSDVVLAIAKYLDGLLQKGFTLHPNQANHFRKIITTIHPLSGLQLDYMITLFENLPKDLTKIQNIESKHLLAFITHHIEAPLLSLSDIKAPLARHKHIAQRQRRNWKDMSENNIYDERRDEFATLISYIKNVSQELIAIDKTIDLTNFDFAFRPEISFAISPAYTRQLDQMKQAKEIIETAIAEKIDRSLEIRDFLTDGQQIDLIKLPELLGKINNFFTLSSNKEKLLNAICQACTHLLKNQIIDAVQNNAVIDLNYILNLNQALGYNILKLACKDTTIRDILTKYIKTCDGSQSNLSIFFVEIHDEENNQEKESLILSYAQKRLSFINTSYDVRPEDYYFFNHFRDKAFFKPLFEKFAQNAGLKIKKALNEIGVWDKGYAGLIELFGTTIEAQAYRAKRLLELAESPSEFNNTRDLNQFLFQLNPAHHVEGNIIDLKLTIKNALSVEKLIENIIMNTSWSLSLEHIIQSLNKPFLTQLLHTQLLKSMLLTTTDISQNWLALTIASQTKYFNDVNKISKSIWDQLNKDFYTHFFGEKNTQELCYILENIYLFLINTEKNLDENAKISSLHFQATCNQIKYAKLFSMLYLLFGENNEMKQFINRLDEFEKKFRLQYELNTIFAENHPALSTTSSNVELKNLILSIVKAEKQLETDGVADTESVHHYLQFCNKEILEKIRTLLANNSRKLKFDALSDLTNLLFHLSCDEIKLLLINAHKPEISSNPFWLSIINHYHNEKNLADIVKLMPNQPTSKMKRLFSFSHNLTNLNKQMHALLKKSILEEAGIIINTTNEGIKMRTLLTEENINDKTLMKLWLNYHDKIAKLQESPSTQKNYLAYGIKLLSRISDELLVRAQKRPEVNKELIEMTQRPKVAPNKKPMMTKDRSSFWARPAEQLELSAHVKSIHDKSIIISLMHVVTKYVNHKMQKDISFFEEACQTRQYLEASLSKEDSISDIIKRTSCARPTAIKFLNCIHLYQKLSAILSDKERFQTIREFINQLISELVNDQINTPKYSKFLKGLLESMNSLVVIAKSAKNDKDFGKSKRIVIS